MSQVDHRPQEVPAPAQPQTDGSACQQTDCFAAYLADRGIAAFLRVAGGRDQEHFLLLREDEAGGLAVHRLQSGQQVEGD